jgi:hypothetical protein
MQNTEGCRAKRNKKRDQLSQWENGINNSRQRSTDASVHTGHEEKNIA